MPTANKHDKKFYILTRIFVAHHFFSCSQTSPEQYLDKGDNFYRQKDFGKAIEQYDQAIKKKNDFVQAYINKGQALEFERKFHEALDNYNLLLAIILDQIQALTRRGYVFKASKIPGGNNRP